MYSELKQFFMQDSYKEMSTNSDLLTVLYKENGANALVLVLNNIVSGIEATSEQYAHVMYQIEQAFRKKGFYNVELLSIICTKNVDRVKSFCTQDAYTHWVVDMNQNRLVIYENQLKSHLQIQRMLEQFLGTKSQPIYEQVMDRKPEHMNKQPMNIKAILNNYPVVTISIVAINVIVFILCALTGSTESTMHLFDWGASEYDAVVYDHEYYRLIAAMFLHAGPEHLINNMFVLMVIGERLEKILGKARYFIIYMLTGLFASIGSILYYHWMGEAVVGVGASGAIFGIIGGVFYMVIRYRGSQTGMSTNRMVLFFLLSLYSGVRTSSNVDNTAHIVGCISGVILTFIIDELRKRKRTR